MLLLALTIILRIDWRRLKLRITPSFLSSPVLKWSKGGGLCKYYGGEEKSKYKISLHGWYESEKQVKRIVDDKGDDYDLNYLEKVGKPIL